MEFRVGIQLGYIEEQLAVMAPLEGMPAKAQGVKAGDLILHLLDEQKDLDTDTKGMSLQEAVDRGYDPCSACNPPTL